MDKNQAFFDAAIEKFGDKVVVQDLKVEEEDAAKMGFTAQDIKDYGKHAWIPMRDEAYRCPVCDAALGGIFGSFKWGIQHGVGTCSECNAAQFRYYHYIVKGKPPLQIFALTGF